LLIGHPRGGELAQLFIDERQQFGGGFRIALLDAVENAGHVAHALTHITIRREREDSLL
jgi:hypothetical protein